MILFSLKIKRLVIMYKKIKNFATIQIIISTLIYKKIDYKCLNKL